MRVNIFTDGAARGNPEARMVLSMRRNCPVAIRKQQTIEWNFWLPFVD